MASHILYDFQLSPLPTHVCMVAADSAAVLFELDVQ